HTVSNLSPLQRTFVMSYNYGNQGNTPQGYDQSAQPHYGGGEASSFDGEAANYSYTAEQGTYEGEEGAVEYDANGDPIGERAIGGTLKIGGAAVAGKMIGGWKGAIIGGALAAAVTHGSKKEEKEKHPHHQQQQQQQQQQYYQQPQKQYYGAGSAGGYGQ